MKKLSALLLLLLNLLPACRLQDRAFQRDYARTLAEERDEALMLALFDLDRAYPDRLEIKITLGGMLLAAGDLEHARILLERGERLVRRRRDAGLEGLLYTNLAELCYRQGEYARCADCAERALQAAPDRAAEVLYTRAKCLYALGRYDESLACFRRARENAIMTVEDLEVYTALLLRRGLGEEALALLGDRERTQGYLLGLGLLEASVYERLGRLDEAVLAAAKDMEYRRSHGLLGDEHLLERLRVLDTLFPELTPLPSAAKPVAVAAYAAFVRGKWEHCAALLEGMDLEEPGPFYDYLLGASLLESGAGGPAQLAAYRRLEAVFFPLPAYYYHLWRGLKAGFDYDIFSARPVLERCILLAPLARYARESRVELGRLLDLSEEQGEKLLLGAELDDILARLQAGADPNILDPVLEVLALPDNVYRVAALLVLERANRLPAVAAYLAGRMQPSPSPLPD